MSDDGRLPDEDIKAMHLFHDTYHGMHKREAQMAFGEQVRDAAARKMAWWAARWLNDYAAADDGDSSTFSASMDFADELKRVGIEPWPGAPEEK